MVMVGIKINKNLQKQHDFLLWNREGCGPQIIKSLSQKVPVQNNSITWRKFQNQLRLRNITKLF